MRRNTIFLRSCVLSWFQFLTLCTLLLATGCTREVPKVNTNVALDLSKIINQQKMGPSAASVGPMAVTVGHVALSISGPGMPTLNLSWSAHGYGGQQNVWTGTMNAEVPTGAARLFQVLVVKEDSTDGSYAFYYGDKLQDVSSSTTDVFIALDDSNADGTPDPISAPGVSDGQIAGRILSSATTGPTGRVRIMYTPPRGPKMEVENSVIVNGWFSVFGLMGLEFNYLLDDNSELFGAPKKIDSWTSGSEQLAIAYMPSYYWADGDPNQATTRFLSAASRKLIGWHPRPSPITGTQTTNIINHMNHTFSNNEPIRFSGLTGGSGLVNGTLYYVRNPVAGVSYEVSLSSGGASVDFTTDITAGKVAPDLTSKRVCYNSATTNIDYAYDSANVTITSVRQWVPADATTATAHMLFSSGYATANLDANGFCDPTTGASTTYSDLLRLDERRISANDSFSGFKAPFQPLDFSGGGGWPKYVDVDYSSGTNTLSVNWRFLPEVYANPSATPATRGVDGVDVYLRILDDTSTAETKAENYRDMDDRIRCDLLSGVGFTKIVDNHPAPTSPTVDDSISYVVPSTSTLGNFSSAINDGRAQIIVCAYGITGYAGKTYLAGLDFQNFQGFNGGSMQADEIEIQLPNGSSTGNIATNVCTPITVLGKSNGGRAQFPPGTQFSFAGLTSTNYYWDYTTCSSAGSSITFPLGSFGGDNFTLYMKKTSGTGLETLTVSDSNGSPLPNATAAITFAAAPAAAKMKVRLMPGPFRSYNCAPVTLEFWSGTGSSTDMLVPFGGGGITMEAVTATTALKFFADNDWACQTEITGATANDFAFDANAAQVRKFVQLNTSGVSTLTLNFFNAAFTGGTYGSALSNLTMNSSTGVASIPVTNPGALHHYSLWMPMNVPSGACMGVDLRFEDSYGNATPYLAATVNVTLTPGTNGAFYATSSDCSSQISAITTQAFAPGATMKRLYYRNDGSGGSTASVSAVSTSPAKTSGVLTVNVQ